MKPFSYETEDFSTKSLVELLLAPKTIIAIGIGILVFSYMTIYLIDMLNIFGLRMLFEGGKVPLMWHWTFVEAGPVEVFQWLFLGGFIITSGYLVGGFSQLNESKKANFWLIMAIGGVLMLIEDAANVRHPLITSSIIFDWHTVNILETIYFLFIAFLPVIAVIKYRKILFKNRKLLMLFVLAFLFYGTAGFVTGDTYVSNGLGIVEPINNAMYNFTVYLGGEDLQIIYEDSNRHIAELEEERGSSIMDVGMRLNDYILEESLELLGATMFLAAALMHRKDYLNSIT